MFLMIPSNDGPVKLMLFLALGTACNLQGCLNKNTYSPSKCDTQFRKLYECCGQMYDRTGDKGESTACPLPRVVRRWLKSHS